jgi:hypothetical protein
VDRELPIAQAEARRRLSAAVALSEAVPSIEGLGRVTGFSEGVWRSIGRDPEGRRRRFLPRHADAAARACHVPYEWFTVPDLAEAVRLGAEQLRPGDKRDLGSVDDPLDDTETESDTA